MVKAVRKRLARRSVATLSDGLNLQTNPHSRVAIARGPR
jgi:hypothetical protein